LEVVPGEVALRPNDLFARGHEVNSYGRFLYGPDGARRDKAHDLAGRNAA